MAKYRERALYGMCKHRGVSDLEFSDHGKMICYLTFSFLLWISRMIISHFGMKWSRLSSSKLYELNKSYNLIYGIISKLNIYI